MGLYPQPTQLLFDVAQTVDTPAVIYDLDAVRHVAHQMQTDIGQIANARLNVAVKACHRPEVLRFLRELGLGCDVASTGELTLAMNAGFEEISCTGPAFSAGDFRRFLAAGITPDVDSTAQLDLFGRHFPGSDVGLRLRLRLPKQFESNATFGMTSRFGMTITDPEVAATLIRHRLRCTRLHVHTGQMTPASLLYKVDYLLSVAELLSDVQFIDFGGGLFHLYPDPVAARAAFRSLAARLDDFADRTDRRLHIRFEPGGALLGPCGYLVAEVRSVEDHHPGFGLRVVTVDASAWNLAPWHRPQALVVPDRDWPDTPALIAGNTLYEGDFFGVDEAGALHPLVFPKCLVGDRLVLTVFGAYTLTNGRQFNRIPAPAEHVIAGGTHSSLGMSV